MVTIYSNGVMDTVCKIARDEIKDKANFKDHANTLLEDFYENQLYKPFTFTHEGYLCIISRTAIGNYEGVVNVPMYFKISKLKNTYGRGGRIFENTDDVDIKQIGYVWNSGITFHNLVFNPNLNHTKEVITFETVLNTVKTLIYRLNKAYGIANTYASDTVKVVAETPFQSREQTPSPLVISDEQSEFRVVPNIIINDFTKSSKKRRNNKNK
jgi:hypothetical protein